MLLVVVTDKGILSQPLEATSQADAVAQLKDLYGVGSGQVRFALLSPTVMGVIQQASVAADATISMTGDAQTQKQIRDALVTALKNNQDYVVAGSHTSPEIAAQVVALTRQVDGLIRSTVGDLSGTT